MDNKTPTYVKLKLYCENSVQQKLQMPSRKNAISALEEKYPETKQ